MTVGHRHGNGGTELVDPAAVGDPAEGTRFLATIFGADDSILVRPVETWDEGDRRHSRTDYKGTIYVRPRTADVALPAVFGRSAAERTNAFFGVCPRFAAPGYDLAWQVRRLVVVWADHDHLRPEGVAAACEAAGLPLPSTVVDSGRGVHLYWILVEPYCIDDVGDPPQVQTEWRDIDGKRVAVGYFTDPATNEKVYLKDPQTGRSRPHNHPSLSTKAQHVQDVVAGIAAALGADATHDLSRLLRIPGSLNRKNQRNGREPVPCRIADLHPARRYPFAEFERFAPLSPQKTKREQVAKIALPAVRKLTPRRADYLNGLVAQCRMAQPGTRSEADFALCVWAIRKGVDKQHVRDLVADVGKFAERGDNYFDRTWEKAEHVARQDIAAKAEVATGDGDDPGDPPEGDDGDSRPCIKLVHDEHRVNDAALEALAADESLFQRGGQLVHVAADAEFADDGIARPTGTPRIIAMGKPTVRDRLSRSARFVVDKKRGDEIATVRASVPQQAVEAIHARGQWPGIRPLDGVVTSPVLRRDGTILASPGYDPQTRLIYCPAGTFPEVPAAPTEAEIRESRERLSYLLVDFPFATEAHRATVVAAMLTVLARQAFDGPAPLFAIDATTRGSGKTLLADLVSTITTGRPASRMSHPRDDDEARKRITAVAKSADPFVLIDNVAGMFGCPSLDAALTADRWKDRLLGGNETIDVPLRTVWACTGNNLQFGADTARRIAHIRLVSPLENPEERDDVREPDLLGFVRTHRPRLLADVLVLLRAWFAAGCPRQPLKPWGSFDGWSNVVRQCVVFHGLADPGGTRTEVREKSDTEAMGLRLLIESWGEMDERNEGISSAEIARRLDLFDQRYPRFRAAILDLVSCQPGKSPDARRIGNKLRHLQGRVVGGKHIDMMPDRKGLALWFVAGADSADSADSGSGHLYAGDEKIAHTCIRARDADGRETESADTAESAGLPPEDDAWQMC